MTARTCRGYRFLVIIRMTVDTVGGQSEVGVFLAFCFSLGNELLFMAIRAGFFGVGARQFKTGKVVVELILVETNDLKIYPVMVVVAAHATLSSDLCRGMISSFLFGSDSDLRMTVETLVVGDLVAERMAFGTVRNAFEMRMDGSQRTGRDLG